MLRLRFFVLLALFSLLLAACVPASPATQPGTPQALSPTQPALRATPTLATPVPTPTSPPATPAGPTPSGAWIALSPQTASPGGTVQIQGYLPGGPDQAGAQGNRALQHANICWQDCQTGMVIQGLEVTWSAGAAGNFTIQVPVPAVPYLDGGKPRELTPGDYTLGVQCLGEDQKGCAMQPAQASAVVHLQGEAQKTCPNAACAELTLSPAQAEPGTQVQASGWAPLDQVIGQMAFGYSLVLLPQGGEPVQLASLDQQLDGSFTASFTVPQSVPGVGVLQAGQYSLGIQAARPQGQGAPVIAQAPFQLGQGLAWKDLSAVKPDWISPSAVIAGAEMQSDASGNLIYCTLGSLRSSTDAGKSWTDISAAGVEAAASAAGYPLEEEQPGKPDCLAAWADPSAAGSFYAAFRTMKKDLGAPPVYYMGFYTSDAGKTWRAVPVPAETTAERFGGFAYGAQGIEALFGGEGTNPANPGPVFGEATRDGGKTWSAATLTCPTSGPCLRWGPSPSSISGMGSPAPQYPMISGNGGQTWTFPGPSVELRAPGPNQLAVQGSKLALLISASGDFPLQVSRDQGNNWQAVSLPALPGGGSGFPFSGLQILPDGSLLAFSDAGGWQRLAPGAAQWCGLSKAGLPSQPVRFTAAGGKLWWLTQPETSSGQLPQPQSTLLSAVQCGG
ncbi:MAG TPA: sialidase family protein [Anaerolineaceae bacterium]